MLVVVVVQPFGRNDLRRGRRHGLEPGGRLLVADELQYPGCRGYLTMLSCGLAPQATLAAERPVPLVSSPTSSSAKVTIDISFYPFIFDGIVAYAPHESLLALRGVSKATLAAADARLFH